jgi:hypothetical protein
MRCSIPPNEIQPAGTFVPQGLLPTNTETTSLKNRFILARFKVSDNMTICDMTIRD